ncbi:MAG: MarR family EPS-associated transcriptional regulator [Candidatus Aureabacteria bacterium]|nr:MarR family EPS-associated transcriptional regulator [Candidatus Auribacterota bacterium]
MNKPTNHRDQEHSLKVLNVLENNSESTQRELSEHIDISLGKINFILSSLIKSGYIKANRFKNSKNKRAYFYILTPKGLKQKAIFARNFLNRKIKEYEKLEKEIEILKKHVVD